MKIETKKGIWVSSSFTDKFGNKDIKPAKTVPSFKILPRAMNDSEIIRELGVEKCTLEDVAAFLKNPPEGCDDGYPNLFYVAGYVVHVFWFGGNREWDVRAWRLDVDRWDAGNRAFSRNSPSEPLASSTVALKTLEQRIGRLEKILAYHKLDGDSPEEVGV